MKLRPFLAPFLALLCVAASPAPLDEPQKSARLIFDSGVKSLRSGAFNDALPQFERAYALWQNPKILANIATTLRQLNRLPEAANAYASFLTTAALTSTSSDNSDDLIEQTKSSLLALDQQLSILVIELFDPNDSVSIDASVIPFNHSPSHSASFGWLACDSTARLRLRLAPGHHHISLANPSKPPLSFDILLSPGISQNLEFPAPSSAVSLAPSAPPKPVPAASSYSAIPPVVPRVSRIGVELRTDIDSRFRGAVLALGPSLGLAPQTRLHTSAIVGKHRGFEFGLNYSFTKAVLRPKISVGIPVFFLDRVTPGVQAAVGAQAQLGSRLSAFVQVGGTAFIKPSETYESSAWLFSSGMEARF